MRVAVYGGSFDPPHVGHAMVAAWLRWTDRCDEVWLVPSFGHPFAKRSAPYAARVRMCEALARELPAARVSTVESTLPTPSYTIDTLRALAAAHPGHTFRLVVGADVVPETPRWRSWDAIEREFAPIVVGRAGYPLPPGSIEFPGVSSTRIRAAAGREDPELDALVPAAILEDVRALYSGGGPTDEAPTAAPPSTSNVPSSKV